MRITLVISSLSVGGAEKVMSTMANYWAGKDHDVTLLTFDDGTPPFYNIDNRVHHVHMDLSKRSNTIVSGVLNNLKRIHVLRKRIIHSRPDIVISFIDQTNIITLLAMAGSGIPVIVSERIDPSLHHIGRRWAVLRRIAYHFAARIVLQTTNAATYFSGYLRRRISIIPNPVRMEFPQVPPEGAGPEERVVVSLGRLVPQKGFDLLVKAFSQVHCDYPVWELVIYGEGPSREELMVTVDQLGLRDKITFPGTIKDPFPALSQSDLFVLSSRYEGFPNALLEAMALGLPVISYDCPSGPKDIIRHGVDGLLVPKGDINALANAMGRLMSDEQERQRLGAQAKKNIRRFSLNRIMGLWEALIGDLAK